MKIDNLTYKNATHNLWCTHAFNHNNIINYYMPCMILKELPGNVKILVFGERRRKTELCGGKKRIRYVDRRRLFVREKNET